MPEAATHAVAETATAGVGETCTMIEAAPHAMAEAVAEFAVPAVISADGSSRLALPAARLRADRRRAAVLR
jgi:hypothetical protein